MFLQSLSSTKGKGDLVTGKQLLDFSNWSKYNAWDENLDSRRRSFNPHYRWWLNSCIMLENSFYAGLIVPSTVSLVSIPHYKILLGGFPVILPDYDYLNRVFYARCMPQADWFILLFICKIKHLSLKIWHKMMWFIYSASAITFSSKDSAWPPYVLRARAQVWSRGVLYGKTYNQSCAFATAAQAAPSLALLYA